MANLVTYAHDRKAPCARVKPRKATQRGVVEVVDCITAVLVEL